MVLLFFKHFVLIHQIVMTIYRLKKSIMNLLILTFIKIVIQIVIQIFIQIFIKMY